MAKFPVESDDSVGIIDAVNYLLSGPQGLGQNFSGFSSYKEKYLTGNFRIPFSQSTTAQLYVASIPLNKAEMLDARTYKYTFTSTQASPPFSLGNGVSFGGFTNVQYVNYPSSVSGRNTSLIQIGVVECTTTYVIVRSVDIMPIQAPEIHSGYALFYTTANFDDSGWTSTDCDVRATITGGTDRVFVSGQLLQQLSYNVITGPSDLRVWVGINRYVGTINNDPTNPDYIFNKDETVARRIYTFPALSGTGSLEIDTSFTSVVDQPAPGYYRYILEVIFEYPTGGVEVQVTTDLLKQRSISAQVVKQ
jgi:hypothetical protein